MVRVRLTGSVIMFVLLLLMALALTGCPSRPSSSREAATSSPLRTAPSREPVAGGRPHSDPAVAAAVQFEAAHCAWNWHQGLASYLAAQQKLATAGYARELAATSDAVSWRTEVLGQKQTVVCTITGATRASDAPSGPALVYVRMSVTSQITSTLGSFDSGQQIACWVVARTSVGWRVAGSFEGG